MSKKIPNPPAPTGGRLLRKPRAPSKPLNYTKPEDSVIVSAYAEPKLPESPPPPQLLPWGNSFTYEYVMAMAYPGQTGEATRDSIHIPHDEKYIINQKELTQASQERFVEGYRDYTYIAGASPPPPSEFSVSPTKTDHELERSYANSPARGERPSAQLGSALLTNYSAPRSRNKTAISKDGKYIIDPVHRQRTNLGTYVEGQSLLKKYKTRGPDPLPVRQPAVRHPQVVHHIVTEYDEEHPRYIEVPEFTLQDFLVKVSEKEKVPMQKVEQIVYSKHNYKKLQNMLAELVINPRVQKQVRPIKVEMPPELSVTTPRVPQKQLVVEMAALIKEQMSAVMNTEMRPVIKPLPKWSPDYKPGVPRPHTEIVLYEGSGPSRQKARESTEISIKIQPDVAQFNTNESLFHSATARYFQGSRRSNSPFAAAQDEGMISPSELAILDTLISGGSALSLKAHFISDMPDIEPLLKTITYLNLSFNDFRSVPYEIFDIENLTVLKLRNNPIRDIPPEISKLKHLKTLVFSFCLVSTLPVALFSLRKLEHLDVAYNRISFIPSEIRSLKRLHELNVEGNQLPAMPVGLLRVRNLRYLRVRNNFMHPLFWKDNAKNEPQSLTSMAALILKQYSMEEHCRGRVPAPLQDMIDSPAKCDCCGGPLYGTGLRMIRPVSRIFGIKNLPFMFRSCSPYCFSKFANSTENMVEILYGTPSEPTLV